ncbi:MAG: 2-phosphosulfolactate phosphatase [Bacillota bacterium]
MEVDLILRAQDIVPEAVRDSWAVVIDVLRATTTITAALEAGCRGIVPALEPDEARALAARWPGHGRDTLLAGERGCHPIPGFDLGNSPQSYLPERVRGRVVFFTTTNGTRALRACRPARVTLCACLRNAGAVVDVLLARRPPRVVLACSGREGGVAPEDVAVAGLLSDRLARQGARLSPRAREAAGLAASLEDWYSFFAGVPAGSNLLRLGYGEDVAFCLEFDRSRVVPRYLRGVVVPARPPVMPARPHIVPACPPVMPARPRASGGPA